MKELADGERRTEYNIIRAARTASLIQVPVTIRGHEALVLTDSGATNNCMGERFAAYAQVDMTGYAERTVMGNASTDRFTKYASYVPVKHKGLSGLPTDDVFFGVLARATHRLISGSPWLDQHCATIHYTDGIVDVDFDEISVTLRKIGVSRSASPSATADQTAGALS